MAEFDDKLNSILSNPEIMQQIMSMAGAMNQQSQQTPPSPPPQQSQSAPGLPFDPNAMAGMMELLKNTQIDQRQRNLLQALRGFVPDDRLSRLEKAMQASKIARYASTAMNRSKGR